MDILIKKFAFIIFVLTYSFNSTANILSVDINKLSHQNKIEVKYKFSKPIKELYFKNAPDGFISKHWQLASEKPNITISNKIIHLKAPSKHISLIVTDGFDTSEIRAYSPYIFMKKQTAVFLDYFLPHQIIDASIERGRAIKPSFKVTLQSEMNKKETFTVNSENVNRYIFIENEGKKIENRTSFFISQEVPKELNQVITSSVNTLLHYFEHYFNYTLPQPVEVIVNYNKNKEYIGFEGSALNGQVVLELSGKDLLFKPKQFKTFILHTLAHEAVHLWNGYVWSQVPNSPTWLYEGSTDHLAYEALLNLELIPVKHYDYFYQVQLEECKNALSNKALNNVDNTPYFNSAYSCGRVIFKKLEQISRKENQVAILKRLFYNSGKGLYSINNLLDLIENAQVKDLIRLISSSEKDALKAFEELMAL